MLDIHNTESTLGVKLPKFIRKYYNIIGKDDRIRIDNFPHNLEQLSILKNGLIEIYNDNMSGYQWAIHPGADNNIYCLEDNNWINQEISISDFFLYKLYWRASTSGSLKYNAMGVFSKEYTDEVIKTTDIKVIQEFNNPFVISFYHLNKNDIIAIENNTIYLATNDKGNFEKILEYYGNHWLYVSTRDSTIVKFDENNSGMRKDNIV